MNIGNGKMLKKPSLKYDTKRILALSIYVGLAVSTNSAYADERESLEQLKATTTNLIDLLVQEGVLPKDKAEAMMKKASQDAAQQVKQAKVKEAEASGADIVAKQPDEKSVRVQYVPEHVKKEMREELKKEVMTELNYKAGERLAMPSWIDRFAFNGDIRLRYQNDSFGDNNAPLSAFQNEFRNADVLNSSEERRRLRVRTRLGTDVKVNDWLNGGLRFTTGLFNTPVTPNQTEGIAQGKYQFGLDAAFLRAKPVEWAMIEGGRFANPFFNTDLVWDPDLAFDGVAATFNPKLTSSLTSFTTVGAFPIEEIQGSEVNKAKDKWIYALQTGIQWQSSNKSIARLGLSYYDFKNVEGIANPVGLNVYDATAPAWRQKGNNTFDLNKANAATQDEIYGLASEFKLINVTGQIDIAKFNPVHVTLTGDYVKNIGFDEDEIFRRTGNRYEEETDGYQVMLNVGHNTFMAPADVPVKKHDWRMMLGYKYIEADAVLDGYTDSNFALGGTDTKGWLLAGEYGIDKNAWVTLRYFSTDRITGPDLSIDTLLIDFAAKF